MTNRRKRARPRTANLNPRALILNVIDQKREKGGAAYAEGKTLIVFLDAGASVWFPNRVARRLPDPLHFATVWVVGLQGVDRWRSVARIAHLSLLQGTPPASRRPALSEPNAGPMTLHRAFVTVIPFACDSHATEMYCVSQRAPSRLRAVSPARGQNCLIGRLKRAPISPSPMLDARR
jgi:hypothetical protein